MGVQYQAKFSNELAYYIKGAPEAVLSHSSHFMTSSSTINSLNEGMKEQIFQSIKTVFLDFFFFFFFFHEYFTISNKFSW